MDLYLHTAFRALRVLLLLAGWSVFVLAFVYMARDEDANALAAYLVGGGCLLVALWAWWQAWPVWSLGFGAAAAGFGVADRPFTAVLLLVALVTPVAVGIADDRRGMQAYRGSELELSGPDDPVPSEDEAVAAALEVGGYRRLGVFRWRLGEDEAATTLLVGRERDRTAGIAGGELELVSRFGERRLVTSTWERRWPATPDELCQRLAYGEYQNVQAAHQRALGLLAARGIRPDAYSTDAEAAGAVHADAEDIMRRVAEQPLRVYLAWTYLPRHPIEHVLGDDERSRRRIDAWLAR